MADLFAPSHDVIQSVSKWLHDERIVNVTLSGDNQWLFFDTKIAALEQLLNTTYYEYENPQAEKLSIGCDQ